MIKPKDFNSEIISSEKIFGGNTIKEAASIFHDVLNLRATKEQTNVVLANSALAISTVKEIGISDAFEIANYSNTIAFSGTFSLYRISIKSSSNDSKRIRCTLSLGSPSIRLTSRL